MKKIIFFAGVIQLILILSVSQSLGQNKEEGFVINGVIPGLPASTLVVGLASNGRDTLAAVESETGKFKLAGNLSQPDGVLLSIPSLKKQVFLFIGNENVDFFSKDTAFSSIQITGSAVQQDYEHFLYDIKPLSDYVNFYRMQYRSAVSSDQRDSLAIMLNTAYGIYQNSIDRFISRRPYSPVASLLLVYAYETDPNKDINLLEIRFEKLEDDALQTSFAASLRREIENGKIGAVGTKALDFTQEDKNGTPISLSGFKGKYVLIDFWASWCKPCRIENPNVVAAYNQFKSKNFTVLGVSLDQSKERWLEAIKDDGLEWTQVSDLKYWQNEVAQLYHIESIPQNFLVDPNGIIIAKNLRGEDLIETLSSILK